MLRKNSFFAAVGWKISHLVPVNSLTGVSGRCLKLDKLLREKNSSLSRLTTWSCCWIQVLWFFLKEFFFFLHFLIKLFPLNAECAKKIQLIVCALYPQERESWKRILASCYFCLWSIRNHYDMVDILHNLNLMVKDVKIYLKNKAWTLYTQISLIYFNMKCFIFFKEINQETSHPLTSHHF